MAATGIHTAVTNREIQYKKESRPGLSVAHLLILANTHCHLVQENSTTFSLLIKHVSPFPCSENALINASAISIRLQTERSDTVKCTGDKHIRAESLTNLC